jgi:RNA polymerase sigma factor (sigma-70 family)
MEYATAVEFGHAVPSPPVLSRLLTAVTVVEQDEAWAEFVATYSGVFLHACHKVARDHDAAMDGYAYVLEMLREHDFRRLRTYAPVSGARFTTWLVVVARRLLLDRQRQRYGRPGVHAGSVDQGTRRRLEDLVAAELDPDQTPDRNGADSDMRLRQRELASALRGALDELSPAERLLLVLRFEDGRSAREIAPVVGAPTVFHVYRQLAAVLATLRRSLSQRGIDDPNP